MIAANLSLLKKSICIRMVIVIIINYEIMTTATSYQDLTPEALADQFYYTGVQLITSFCVIEVEANTHFNS